MRIWIPSLVIAASALLPDVAALAGGEGHSNQTGWIQRLAAPLPPRPHPGIAPNPSSGGDKGKASSPGEINPGTSTENGEHSDPDDDPEPPTLEPDEEE